MIVHCLVVNNKVISPDRNQGDLTEHCISKELVAACSNYRMKVVACTELRRESIPVCATLTTG